LSSAASLWRASTSTTTCCHFYSVVDTGWCISGSTSFLTDGKPEGGSLGRQLLSLMRLTNALCAVCSVAVVWCPLAAPPMSNGCSPRPRIPSKESAPVSGYECHCKRPFTASWCGSRRRRP
jgi:hypothetical protein